MSLFSYFRLRPKKGSAHIAKERLQIIVAHERGDREPDFLPALQRDLLDVIKRYVEVDQEQVSVKLDNVEGCAVLELNVPLPAPSPEDIECNKT